MNFFKKLNSQFKSCFTKNIFNTPRYKAFTLAEVLITLGIIGVIAAMTIPELVSNINDKALKTAWINDYAIVAQATESMRTENGGTNDGIGFVTCVSSGIDKMNYYNSFYNSAKVVIYGNTSCGNLYGVMNEMYNTTSGTSIITGPNGNTSWNYGGSGDALILNNGSFVIYRAGNLTDASGQNCIGTPAHRTLGLQCSNIYIDVNGAKSPNIWGKDVFGIVIAQRGIYPIGVNPSTSTLDTCDATSNFYNCGAWILANPDFKVPY